VRRAKTSGIVPQLPDRRHAVKTARQAGVDAQQPSGIGEADVHQVCDLGDIAIHVVNP